MYLFNVSVGPCVSFLPHQTNFFGHVFGIIFLAWWKRSTAGRNVDSSHLHSIADPFRNITFRELHYEYVSKSNSHLNWIKMTMSTEIYYSFQFQNKSQCNVTKIQGWCNFLKHTILRRKSHTNLQKVKTKYGYWRIKEGNYWMESINSDQKRDRMREKNN